MKFTDAIGNVKYGKAMFFGNNIQMSEQADGIVTINAGILSGTGSKLSLLGDVSVTSIQDDQFVRWNAGTSLWINQFITAADVGAGTFKTGTFTFPNTVIHSNLTIFSGTDIGDIQTGFGASTQRIYGNLQMAGDNLIGGGFGTGPAVNLLMYAAYSGTGGSARGEPALVTYKARGNLTTPLPPKDLDRLFSYGAGGWNGSSWSIGSTIAVEAFGDWGGGLGGTRYKFFVTASGTSTGAYVLAIEKFLFYPLVDNSLSLGTTALRFKDLPLAGNLTVSGTTTLIGAATQRVGTSATFAKWPSILYANSTAIFNSGIVQSSLDSYTLKANSLTTNAQAIKVRGHVRRAASGGSNFQVLLGNLVLVSGTLGSVQATSFEGTCYRISATTLRSYWTVYSGVTDFSISSFGTGTPMIGIVLSSPTVDLTLDQLIDFRVQNYVADGSGITLEFWQISYEAS